MVWVKEFLIYILGVFLTLIITVTSTYYFAVYIDIHYIISGILGYLLGLFIIITFQAFFNFQTKEELNFANFLKFILVQLIGLVFYLILISIFIKFSKFDYLGLLIISATLTYILNFLNLLLTITFIYKKSK